MSQNQKNKKNTIMWGPATRKLLHILASKVDNQFFVNKKNEILDLIKLICFNLPCPTCSQHSKQIIIPIFTNKITTKELLIDFLFSFHNHVNERSGKPQIKKENLKKYENMNLGIAIHNFKIFYAKSYNNNTFHLNLQYNQTKRKNVVNKTINFINKNLKFFT